MCDERERLAALRTHRPRARGRVGEFVGLPAMADRAVRALAEAAHVSWAEVVRCAARTLLDAYSTDPGLLDEAAHVSWGEVVRCAGRTLLDASSTDPGLLDEPWISHAYGDAEPGPLPGDAAERTVNMDTSLVDALTAVAAERGEPRSATVRLAVDLFLARAAIVGWPDAVGVPPGGSAISRVASLPTRRPTPRASDGEMAVLLRPDAARSLLAFAEAANASTAEVVRCAARTLLDAHRTDPGLLDEPWISHAYGDAEPGPLPGDAAERTVNMDTSLVDALTAVAAERGEPRSATVRLAVDLFLARAAIVGWPDAVGVPPGGSAISRVASLPTRRPAVFAGEMWVKLRPDAARSLQAFAEAANAPTAEVVRCAARTLLDAHRTDPGLLDEPWISHAYGDAGPGPWRGGAPPLRAKMDTSLRDALTAVAAERGETRSETLRLAVDLFLARSAAVGWPDAGGVPRPAPAPDLW